MRCPGNLDFLSPECLCMLKIYLLTCMRYIELNPVRVNMTNTAAAYRLSSYSYNGSGRKDDLITPYRLYLGLGKDDPSRRIVYKALFRHHMPEEAIGEIRSAWQTGTPLGND